MEMPEGYLNLQDEISRGLKERGSRDLIALDFLKEMAEALEEEVEKSPVQADGTRQATKALYALMKFREWK